LELPAASSALLLCSSIDEKEKAIMNKYIHNLRLLAQIFRNQYKKPADIARQQEKLLAETIKYAYKNVGYYRELFDRHSIKPEQITRLRDLPVIPITTKDDIRNNRDRILSEGCDKPVYCEHFFIHRNLKP
jgi:phenylacetate-coenzyme A ligase PaaK-like adenylate-forming protein